MARRGRQKRRTGEGECAGGIALEEWIWRGIRMLVPGEWELLLFSRNLADGSCTFADRHAYRMQVAWSAMDIEPDVAMTMDSYIQKLRHELEGAEVKRCDMKGWAGSFLQEKGRPPQCRFVRFFKDPALLIEVIFPSAKGETPPMKNILSKLVASADLSRWQAFGIALRTPEGLSLQSCDVKPAATRFEFISRDKRSTCKKASFGRLGMLKHWLLGSISDYLRLQLPRRAMVEEEGGIDFKGHSGAWVRGR
ncbi:MAG: hypothetical protein JW808_08595, partial [Victivallales bacterium]|nr:hypothetical protein [Victivallales bacterium]